MHASVSRRSPQCKPPDSAVKTEKNSVAHFLVAVNNTTLTHQGNRSEKITENTEPEWPLAVLILIDLRSHDHDPDQKDGADDPEGECGAPALT